MNVQELGGMPVSTLSLRQHFAGLAMASMVGDPRTQGERWDWLASQAVNAADALLSELAKET